MLIAGSDGLFRDGRADIGEMAYAKNARAFVEDGICESIALKQIGDRIP